MYDPGRYLQRELDAKAAGAAMHVLDWDAEGGSAGDVAYRPNSLHDFGKLCA
jgi:hypothetical protein